MTHAANRGVEDGDGEPPRGRAVTVRTAAIIAVVAALLAGTLGGVAARLGGGSENEELRVAVASQAAELTGLRDERSQREAELARLTDEVGAREAEAADLRRQLGERSGEVDHLTAELTAVQDQVDTLEAQLEQLLNPDPGPGPTAEFRVVRADRYTIASEEVVVCVELANTSSADVDVYFAWSQFKGLDADGFVYTPRLHTPGYSVQLTTPLSSGALAPGERRMGQVLFDVPTETSLATLMWATGFAHAPELEADMPTTGGAYRGGTCP